MTAAISRRRTPRSPGLGPTILLVLLLCLLGAVFLYAVGIDALEGRSNFLFFADSETYLDAARGDLAGFDGIGGAITVSANYLGPLVMLWLTGTNYYATMLLNAALFLFSVSLIARTLDRDPLPLALLLLANPLVVSSLLSVNKEIISLLFFAMLLRALAKRSWTWMALALATSLLVRWQLALYALAIVAVSLPLNPLRRRRALSLFVMLLALSALYAAFASTFEAIREVLDQSAESYEGSGLHEYLQGFQDRGLYWLVFPFKAAHLLFGMGLHFERLLMPDDIYNDVWQLLHSTATLVLFGVLVAKRRFRLSNDLVFLSVVFCAVFALSPVYAPRYFLPVYFLWAAALAPGRRTVELLPGMRPRAAAPRRPPGRRHVPTPP